MARFKRSTGTENAVVGTSMVMFDSFSQRMIINPAFKGKPALMRGLIGGKKRVKLAY